MHILKQCKSSWWLYCTYEWVAACMPACSYWQATCFTHPGSCPSSCPGLAFLRSGFSIAHHDDPNSQVDGSTTLRRSTPCNRWQANGRSPGPHWPLLHSGWCLFSQSGHRYVIIVVIDKNIELSFSWSPSILSNSQSTVQFLHPLDLGCVKITLGVKKAASSLYKCSLYCKSITNEWKLHIFR